MAGTYPNSGRVDWVDYAKGFCIVFVVMMHSTLGVELAAGQEGWMHYVVAFAKPFRMPDFFLISGLFLARVLDRDWRTYLDRKVIHFAYFYLLWVTIQFAFKAPGLAAEFGWERVGRAYLESFWEPFGTLWFIYLLPIFFVVTKLARVGHIPQGVVWLIAAGLEIATVNTGHTVIDEFAARFVYFYTGYIAASYLFDVADNVARERPRAIAWLFFWGALNGSLIANGYSEMPLVSLALGLLGAVAVITVASLMATTRAFRPLRYLGRNSIVIYLAFFLPMAATRVALLKTGIIEDIGTISVLVTLAGILGALVWFWALRGTPLRFLFERPQRLWMARKPRTEMQPAE